MRWKVLIFVFLLCWQRSSRLVGSGCDCILAARKNIFKIGIHAELRQRGSWMVGIHCTWRSREGRRRVSSQQWKRDLVWGERNLKKGQKRPKTESWDILATSIINECRSLGCDSHPHHHETNTHTPVSWLTYRSVTPCSTTVTAPLTERLLRRLRSGSLLWCIDLTAAPVTRLRMAGVIQPNACFSHQLLLLCLRVT